VKTKCFITKAKDTKTYWKCKETAFQYEYCGV